MTITKGKALLSVTTGCVLAMLASGSVMAAGAVSFSPFDGGNNQLANSGDSISATSQFGASSSFSNDPALNYSANGLIGSWYSFETDGIFDVTVNVTAQGADLSPAMTVWASGGTAFDGGSIAWGSETSTMGLFPHFTFNATGDQGSPGTAWMQDGQGGNMLETLAYANTGPSHVSGFSCSAPGCPIAGPTGWGENIFFGVHDVSNTNTFEQGVSGNLAAGMAELTFTDLQPGWYTVFVGGAYDPQAGGLYDLTVSAVPEMETWAMMLAGMGYLGWRARRQERGVDT
ncbi:pyruvate-binding protein [Pseudomonadota bacterium]